MEPRRRTRQHSTGSDMTTDSDESNPGSAVLSLEHKSIQTYRSQDEYLDAMKEDLAEWLNALYGLDIAADAFFTRLETGVLLCHHANNVNQLIRNSDVGDVDDAPPDVQYREKNVRPGSFLSRDNVSNFIDWCRALGVNPAVRFETDDLVLRKNPRSVVLCLLEVARRGARHGMLAPCLVQLEQEIEAEIAGESPPPAPAHPAPQIKTVDMLSLDEMVREIAGRCTCPTQFQITRVSEGKYRIGQSQTLIFVRILRVHVMVRIGGGWDTLEHFLDKHDPCRCNVGHKAPTNPPKSRRHSIAPVQRHLPETPSKQSMTVTVTSDRPSTHHVTSDRPTTTPLNMQKKRSQSVAPSTAESRDIRSGLSSTLPPGGLKIDKFSEHKSRRQSIDVVISRPASGKPSVTGGRNPRALTRPGSATPSRDRSVSRQFERPMTPVKNRERSGTPLSFRGKPHDTQSKLHKHFHSTGNVNNQNDLSLTPSTQSYRPERSAQTPKPQRQRRQSVGDMSSQIKTSAARSIDFSGRQSPSPDRRRSLSVAQRSSRDSPSPEPLSTCEAYRRGRTPSPETSTVDARHPGNICDTNRTQSKLMNMHNRYQTVDGAEGYTSRKDGTRSECSSTRTSPTRTLPNKPLMSVPSSDFERGRPPSAAARLRPRSARSASVGPRQELSRTHPMRAVHANDLQTLTVRRDDSGRHNIQAINKKPVIKQTTPRTNVRTPTQRSSVSTPNTPKLRRAIIKTPQSAASVQRNNNVCDNEKSESYDDNKNSTEPNSSFLLQQSFDHIADVSAEDIRMHDQMEQLFEALCKQAELQEKFSQERTVIDDIDSLKDRTSSGRYKRSSSLDDILNDPPNPVMIPSRNPMRKRNAAIVTPMRRSPSPQPQTLTDRDFKLSNDINDKDVTKINTAPCAKPRRDPREGTPTRIPGPRGIDHACMALYQPLGQLSRFDSGVDVNNISPTELTIHGGFEEY